MVTNNPVPAKGGSLIGATTINWEDVYKGPNIMWRVPRNIHWGDNVVVRQDESAVFYRDGKVLAYLDKPDRYSLTTLNAGILGNLEVISRRKAVVAQIEEAGAIEAGQLLSAEPQTAPGILE